MVENKQTKQAENVLKAINKKQETHTVKYGPKGKKSRKIVVKDPGALTDLQAADLMNTGDDNSDYIGLYSFVMNNVIINPKLSFEKQDKDIPKRLKTKNVPGINASGKHVTIHMKFPDSRTAIDLVRIMDKPSGASNLAGTLKYLDGYVFKDGNGKAVNDDYWNRGNTGGGLAIDAINAAQVYLSSVLDFNGFSSVIGDGISFLMQGVHRK